MEFQINTNNVILIQHDQVESGEYNVTECTFNFSNEYNGLTKKAVFTGEDGTAYLQTIVDNKCSIPSEILEVSQVVQIGVYAYAVENEELILRYSPEPTNFSIHEGSYKEAQNSTPPTPSEVEQLQAQITSNKNNIEEIQSDVVDINTDITNMKTEQTEQNTNIQNNTDDITELQNTKANKSEIPTKTSDLINDSDFVVDNNYVHTDNNFTNEDKGQIKTNKDDISTINGNIQNINTFINDINQNIDDLEQDLTNYSLITETGSQIELNINSSDFKLKAILKDKNGNTIFTSNIIDLPLETMVVGASYDNVTKEVVLTLQNGTTVRFSVADLVSGLVSTDQLTQVLSNYYTKAEINNLLVNYYTKSEADTLLNEKANQSSLDTTNQNLTNLTGRVSTNEEDIADIKEEQTTQNTNIEELQNKVQELETDVEDLRNASLKVTGEGTDITLQNTASARLLDIDLKGQTEQVQLAGKNKFNNQSTPIYITNVSVLVIDTGIKVTETGNGGIHYADYFLFDLLGLEGKTIRIKSNWKNSSNNQGRIALRTSSSNNTVGNAAGYLVTSGTTISYEVPSTIDENNRYFGISLYVNYSGTANNGDYVEYTDLIVTIDNTDMTFEEYCGGIPAPNSQFPQQIKNVTGNANVKIQNKNLFDGELEIGYYDSNTGEKANSDLLYRNKNIISVKPQTTYTFSINGVPQKYVLLEYKSNGDFIGETLLNGATFTTNIQTSYINFRCFVADYTSDFANLKVQLEEGSTATSYVPHAEQNYPFTFAEGQRGMQGTQLLDDGIHQKRYKFLPTKIAGVIQHSSTGLYYCYILLQKKVDISKLTNMYSTHFRPIFGVAKGQFYFSSRTTLVFILTDQTLNTEQAVNNWLLEQSNNGTPVEFELVLDNSELESNIIPYNETQQAEYDAIKNARSYDDITIISSESDELGFNMNVVAVADANKVIDTQNSEIDTIKSRLDLLEG